MLAALITTLTAVITPMAAAPSMIGAANAAMCPPAEVVFARGRNEPPGPGQVGAAFVNALRYLRGPNISLYPVNYPADTQVDVGANDMSRHVQWMARNCPNTRIVLGGYSLGAAATDLVLAVPISAFTFNSPLPSGTDRHIAAVALFGNGVQLGHADHSAEPALSEPHHRPVSHRRSDLQPEQSLPLAVGMAGSSGAGLYPVGHGRPGGEVRLGPTLKSLPLAEIDEIAALTRTFPPKRHVWAGRNAGQRVRMSRVTAIRAANWSSGG